MQLFIKHLAAVVLVWIVVACNNRNTNATAVIVDTVATTAAPVLRNDVSAPNADSLPTHVLGEMLLNGTFIPTDDPPTFRLMDSLQASTEEARRFYFSVFDQIMDRADGALGEAIGNYTVTYVEQFPQEFITFSKDFPDQRFETWASNVGIELSLSAIDPKEGYKNFSDAVQANCKGCNSYTRQRLQKFNAMVWRTVKENLNPERKDTAQ